MISPLDLKLGNYAAVIQEEDSKNTKSKKGDVVMFLINGVFQESQEVFRVMGIGVYINASFDTRFDKCIPIKLGYEILEKLKFKKFANQWTIPGRRNIKLVEAGKVYALFCETEERRGLFGFMCRLFRIPISWVCLRSNMKYTHDLQNTWYALTGDSLEIEMLRGKTFAQLEKEEKEKFKKSLKPNQNGEQKKAAPKK